MGTAPLRRARLVASRASARVRRSPVGLVNVERCRGASSRSAALAGHPVSEPASALELVPVLAPVRAPGLVRPARAQGPERAGRSVSATPGLVPVLAWATARRPAPMMVRRPAFPGAPLALTAPGVGLPCPGQEPPVTPRVSVHGSAQAPQRDRRLTAPEHLSEARASLDPLSYSASLAPVVLRLVRCFARYAARQRVHRTQRDTPPRPQSRRVSVQTMVALVLVAQSRSQSRTGER